MMSVLILMSVLASSGNPRLYSTPEDVARGRENVQQYQWAQKLFQPMRANADKWAEKSEEQLGAIVPPPGSVFAYGFSGCPECNANWEWWGAGGVASFDRPGVVICPSCKRSYPDAEHPDPGSGWKRPEDGRMFYFAGVYNAFAIKQITQALQDLAYSYALTGDCKYSRAAASLFDRLADTYPSSPIGAQDYPYDTPANRVGRLETPIYITCRSFVLYADQYDLLCESPDFAAPSASGKGSIADHVKESIIRNGGAFSRHWLHEAKGALSNAGPDYMRATLAAGILLGDEKWIDDALNCPYSVDYFLSNMIDRDGQNYQVSLGYANHGVRVNVEVAEMLYNYRSPEHPNGINYYTQPRLQAAMYNSGVDTDCVGHAPRIGNWQPDFSYVGIDRLFSFYPYVYSEILVSRAKTGEERARWEAARDAVAMRPVEEMRSKPIMDNWQYWLLLHARPLPETETRKPKLEQKAVLGGKGMAFLRSGRAPAGSAAMLRYGPTFSQAHLDSMNLGVYALGRELTYDFGFLLGSAHVQTGWARGTSSHNLVVVNEKSQMAKPCAGGSAYFHVDAAPVRAFEASDESCYASENVKTYRRMMALVDVPGSRSYLLDIFRVAGGSKHDLMWHFIGKLGEPRGAKMGEVQSEGSLAGKNIDWGRKVGAGGDIIGCGDKPPYWNPPPENGYGFLYNVRRSQEVQPECSFDWNIPDTRQKVVLRLLPEPGSEVVMATAPGILPDYPTADFAILRRQGSDLKSAFVSVVEPVTGDAVVRSASRMVCECDPSLDAVGVEVRYAGGVDYILSAMKPGSALFRTQSGERIEFSGRFGFLRVSDGKVRRGVLVGGTELSMGSYRLSSPASGWTGDIVSVEPDNLHLQLDTELPGQIAGQLILFSRDSYARASSYGIVQVDGKRITLDGDTIIGRGQVGDAKPTALDAVMNVVALKRSVDIWARPIGYYQSKCIKNDRTGKTTTIKRVDENQMTLYVEDPRLFKPGDRFTILDLQTGDRYEIPAVVVR